MQTQLINFTIPRLLLQVVDQQAAQEMKTRSELIRDAVRSYLERKTILRQRWQDLFQLGSQKAQTMGLKSQDVERLVDDYRAGQSA